MQLITFATSGSHEHRALYNAMINGDIIYFSNREAILRFAAFRVLEKHVRGIFVKTTINFFFN